MKEKENVFEEKALALLSSQSLDREETREAAKVLNEHIIPKMMGVLKKLGADITTAEEVAKQAVDKVTKMITKFDPSRARLSTWMTKIAINLLNEKRRKGLIPLTQPISLESTHPSLEHEFYNTQIESIENNPLEESEFVRKIKSVLHLLSVEERTIISFELNCVPKEFYMKAYSISDDAYRQRKSRTYKKVRDMVFSNTKTH